MLMTVCAAALSGRSIVAVSIFGVAALGSWTVPEVAAAIASLNVAKHFGADTFDAVSPGSTGSICTMQWPRAGPALSADAAGDAIEPPLDASARLRRPIPTRAFTARRGMREPDLVTAPPFHRRIPPGGYRLSALQSTPFVIRSEGAQRQWRDLASIPTIKTAAPRHLQHIRRD